ncbi:MAG: VCBS repeat-containing protein [Candidatus Atribacteria bacterium]|nr:MAG: VCBS repeat-containing protein [Candidatus Atribacteria bacterium]
MRHVSKTVKLILLLALALASFEAFAQDTATDEWMEIFSARSYSMPGGAISYSDALPINYGTELEAIAVLNPSRMETGDFDEDGNLDFLVTTIFGEQGDPVSIEDALQGIVTPLEELDPNMPWPLLGTWPTPLVLLFGDGDGGVREAVQITDFTNGSFVTTADLNKDGHLDIICEVAVGHPDWDAPNRPLLLLYGDGTGGFPAASYVNVDPTWFVSTGRWLAADMNGDEVLDLVALGYCMFETPGTPIGAALLLGTEEGSYVNAQSICLDEFALASGTLFDVLDIDKDGDLDIVAAVTVVTSSPLAPTQLGHVGYLLTLENDGTGGLSTDGGRMIPLQPKALTTGDFNGDGIGDIAVSHFADAEITVSDIQGANGEVLYDYHRFGGQSTNISVFFGNGEGGFDDSTTYDMRVTMSRVMADDLNGDGFDDLVAITPNDRRLAVRLGGGERLSEAKLYVQRSFMRWADCLGDFNGDGNLDIGVLGAYLGQIETLFGDGDGGFGSGWLAPPIQAQIPYAPNIPMQGGASDFDGDGHLDVVFFRENSETLGVAFGDGTGGVSDLVSIRLEAAIGNYSLEAIAAGDLNHDGVDDIVVACREKVYFGSSLLWVFLGTHERLFANISIDTMDQARDAKSLALGDFNGDGHADIFVSYRASTGFPQVFAGKGDGTFSDPIDVVPMPEENGEYATGYLYLYVADVNEDGIDDLVAKSYVDTSVALYIGSPSGKIEQTLRMCSGRFVEGVVDLNSDEHIDIVVSDFFLAGNGVGGFEELPIGDFNGALAIDLNGDGHIDRISDYQDTLLVFLGDGDLGSLAQDTFCASGEVDPSFGDYAFGDFNEDGWQDIAYTAGEWLGILLIQPSKLPVLGDDGSSF